MSHPSLPSNVWTGLLQWSIAQGDGFHSNEPLEEMSDERKEFLRKAFDAMVVDETKRLKVVVNILKMPSEDVQSLHAFIQKSADFHQVMSEVRDGQPELVRTSARAKAAQENQPHVTSAMLDAKNMNLNDLLLQILHKKEGALDELDDLVLTIDNARDFHTLGGFKPLLHTLQSKHASLRWRAAHALGTLTQNNPACQQFAHEMGALGLLITLLSPPQNESNNDEWTVVVKSLLAISSLCRSELPTKDEFYQAGGLSRLSKLLSHPSSPSRVIVKVLSLLRLMWQWFPQAKQSKDSEEIIKRILSLIGHEDITLREFVIKALIQFVSPDRASTRPTAAPTPTKAKGKTPASSLASSSSSSQYDHQYGLKELKKPAYNAVQLLKQRLMVLRGQSTQEEKDMNEEEIRDIEALLLSLK